MDIAKTFGEVGFMSWGGGTTTQILMRKAVVDKRQWLSLPEYNRTWQISKLCPGIQLIAQAIMYGRMFGGYVGGVVAAVSFLAPCCFLTALFSVVLLTIQDNEYVEDALRLIVPLTGGMTLAIAFQMWSPEVPERTRGWVILAAQMLAILIAALLVGVVHVPVPLVMLLSLVVGALLPR